MSPTASAGSSRTARCAPTAAPPAAGPPAARPAESVLVRLERGAGAEDVAVAVDAVDAADRRPVLPLPERGHRERGELARVGALPVVARDVDGGVRCVHERVVV